MMQSDAWSQIVREAAEMLERSHEVAEPVALDYANRLHVLADTLRAAHPPEAAPRGEPDAWGVRDNKGNVDHTEPRRTRKLQAHVVWCDEKFPEDAPHTLVPLFAALSSPVPQVTEAQVWLFASRESEQWNALVRRVGPYLQAHMSPDEFSEMVIAYGASCVRAALSAPQREVAPAVSEAMAIAAMREFSAQKGESHDAMWSQMDAQMQAEVISEWRYILAAARDAE